jgi:hypothetical protein
MIYVLWAEGTPLFKIGTTKGTVDRRVRDIAAMSPLRIRIIAEARGGRADELRLHIALREFRDHAEWFALPEEAVWWVLGQCGVDVDAARSAPLTDRDRALVRAYREGAPLPPPDGA